MTSRRAWRLAVVVGLLATAAVVSLPSRAASAAASPPPFAGTLLRPAGRSLRLATFNAAISRPTAGALAAELATPGAAQPARVAAILQLLDADVVALNEFDDDPTGQTVRDFQCHYFAVPQVALGAARPVGSTGLQCHPTRGF